MYHTDEWYYFVFFSSRRRHTRLQGDWSSDVCSSDLHVQLSIPVHVDQRDLRRSLGEASDLLLEHVLGESAMLVIQQHVYIAVPEIGEHQVRPPVAIQIAHRNLIESVLLRGRQNVRHEGCRRLKGAVPVAQRQQVPGGGKIQFPIAVEVRQHYEAGGGKRRGAFLGKRAVAIAQVSVHRAGRGRRRVLGGHQQVRNTVPVQVAGNQAGGVGQGYGGPGRERRGGLPGAQQDGDALRSVHGQIRLPIAIVVRGRAAARAARDGGPFAVLELALALAQQHGDHQVSILKDDVGKAVIPQIRERRVGDSAACRQRIIDRRLERAIAVAQRDVAEAAYQVGDVVSVHVADGNLP